MYEFGCDVSLRIEKMTTSAIKLIDDFDCGNENINSLIRTDRSEPHTVTYLYIDNAEESLVAYVSIACSGIIVDNSEFDGDDAVITPESSIMPAIEIEYYAIDQEYQSLQFEAGGDAKSTLSYYIFMDMIERIREISVSIVGARAIVLYAVPDAVHFYQKCGLRELPPGLSGRTDSFVNRCVPMFIYL